MLLSITGSVSARWRLVLAVMAVAIASTARLLAAEHPYEVDHYAAQIEPDLSRRTLTGEVRIDLTVGKGIRDYTRQYLDRSVTTGDFEAALERSTHRDLSAFFGKWVYGQGAS